MVIVTPSDVYNVLTFHWKAFREIKEELYIIKGLNDPREARTPWTYAYRSFRAGPVDTFTIVYLVKMQDQGLVESKIEPATPEFAAQYAQFFDANKYPAPSTNHYRKLPTGRHETQEIL